MTDAMLPEVPPPKKIRRPWFLLVYIELDNTDLYYKRFRSLERAQRYMEIGQEGGLFPNSEGVYPKGTPKSHIRLAASSDGVIPSMGKACIFKGACKIRLEEWST